MQKSRRDRGDYLEKYYLCVLGVSAVKYLISLGQGGTNLENSLFADFDSPGLRPTRLGNVSGLGARHGHHASGAALAVVSGNGGGTLQGIAVGLLARLGPEYYMASGHTAHMKPPVVGFCDLEAQPLVVRIGLAGQHDPAARQLVLINAGPASLNSRLLFRHVITGWNAGGRFHRATQRKKRTHRGF